MTDGNLDVPISVSIAERNKRDVPISVSLFTTGSIDVPIQTSLYGTSSRDVPIQTSLVVGRIDNGIFGDSVYETAPRYVILFAQGGTPDSLIAPTDPYWFIKSGNTETGKEGFVEIGIGQSTTYDQSDANLTGFVRVQQDDTSGEGEVKIKPSLWFYPSSEPTTPQEGMLYYDSTSHTLKYRDNTAWLTIATGGMIAHDMTGAYHTEDATGGAGNFLKSDSDTTFSWQAHGLSAGDVGAYTTAEVDSAIDADILTHKNLSDAHHPQNHALIDSTGHTVAGLTGGHFLKALTATTYGFEAHGLSASDVSASPAFTKTQWTIPVFDTTTTLGDSMVSQDSGGTALTIGGTIVLPNGTSINEFSIDGTFAGNSDDAVPTEKASKTYTDTKASTEVEMDWADYIDGVTTGEVPGFVKLRDTSTGMDSTNYLKMSDANTLWLEKASGSATSLTHYHISSHSFIGGGCRVSWDWKYTNAWASPSGTIIYFSPVFLVYNITSVAYVKKTATMRFHSSGVDQLWEYYTGSAYVTTGQTVTTSYTTLEMEMMPQAAVGDTYAIRFRWRTDGGLWTEGYGRTGVFAQADDIVLGCIGFVTHAGYTTAYYDLQFQNIKWERLDKNWELP